MRWGGEAARTGGNIMRAKLRQGNMKYMNDLEDLGVDGRIILKLILKK
jgi:hypothetical protein